MLYFKMFDLLFCAIVFWTLTDIVQGRYVYRPSIQRWITQHKVVATWGEAKYRCEKEGAILASPVDKDLLKYMKSFIDVNNHASAYYIGTKARYDPEPQFSSIEGIPLDDMPEAVKDMIDQLDPRDGDCLSMDRKTIRAVPCWSRLPYICYTNVSTTITNENTTASVLKVTTAEVKRTTAQVETTTVHKCYGGYKYSPTGGCYKLYKKHSTWKEANETCSNDGAYLVIFNDENEAKSVVKLLTEKITYSDIGNLPPPPYTPRPSWWVGLRDDTGKGRHWRSVHGDRLEQIYNVWHNYTQTNYISEACGLVNIEAKLLDFFCSFYFPFICEKDV